MSKRPRYATKKVFVAIELVPAHQINDDGRIGFVDAFVREIRASIPSRMIEVRVVSPVFDLDSTGSVVGETTTFAATPREFERKYQYQLHLTESV